MFLNTKHSFGTVLATQLVSNCAIKLVVASVQSDCNTLFIQWCMWQGFALHGVRVQIQADLQYKHKHKHESRMTSQTSRHQAQAQSCVTHDSTYKQTASRHTRHKKTTTDIRIHRNIQDTRKQGRHKKQKQTQGYIRRQHKHCNTITYTDVHAYMFTSCP